MKKDSLFPRALASEVVTVVTIPELRMQHSPAKIAMIRKRHRLSSVSYWSPGGSFRKLPEYPNGAIYAYEITRRVGK